MKPDFEPKLFKNYNLTLAEQIELDNFLKENLEKGYIRNQNPLWHHHSFLSKRRTENYDHARTTDFLMNGQSRMPIPFPLFPKSWTNSKELNISLSSMYNGDITTSGSEKVMNGRLHSRQIEDYSNPLSCSLACVILWKCFNL